MSNCDPFIKKRRDAFFPNGGNRNSQRHQNDHTLEENRRKHHGTDPLKPGHDPGDDPCEDGNREKKKSDIPI
jgi:hypothetical protein